VRKGLFQLPARHQPGHHAGDDAWCNDQEERCACGCLGFAADWDLRGMLGQPNRGAGVGIGLTDDSVRFA
jgi:hypothetical protein